MPAESFMSSSRAERRRRREYNESRSVGRAALMIDGFTSLEKPESPHRDIQEAMLEKIIDQPDAIDAIIDSLDRSKHRLDSNPRPIASLAFLGPTGVGKSETAKLLAELTSGDGRLLKIDCSDYSNGHEVSTLTGSPPGYVGRGQTPLLSKNNVEKRGTVVLFDEIEKGHQSLFQLMLQIMEDGKLRLNNGNTTNFRNAIVIMTSNLGAKEMSREMSSSRIGFGDRERTSDKTILNAIATKQFEEFFDPEFINRIDKMVVFHPLQPDGLGQVLDTKLKQVNREYKQKYGVRLSLSDAARDHIINAAAAQPHLGARPLVRSLEENIQTTFGRHLSSNQIPIGSHVQVFHADDVEQQHDIPDDEPLIFAIRRDEVLRQHYLSKRIVATIVRSSILDAAARGYAAPPEPLRLELPSILREGDDLNIKD